MRRTVPLVVAASAVLLSMTPPLRAVGGEPRGVPPRHDYDPVTLAQYVDLRFSSMVPPVLIRRILAAEGFSTRDLRLVDEAVESSNASPRVSTLPRRRRVIVRRSRRISTDKLACPKTDATACELDTEAEPHIAINPTRSRNVIGVFQMGRYRNGGAVDIGWSTSFDGGKTWPYKGPAPGLTVGVSAKRSTGKGVPFERASDPVVAFDRKHHRVFLQGIGVSIHGCAIYCDSAVTLNISRNNGRKFGRPVIINENVVANDNASPAFFNDKNWIAVDNHPTSPHFGRAYAVWDQLRCPDNGCNVAPVEQPVMISHSDDGGRTWSKPLEAINEKPGAVHQEVGALPVVMRNGHVVIVYPDVNAGVYTFEADLKAIRSTDGGRHWSAPFQIARQDPFAEEGNALRAPNVPSVDVGKDGTIWVAWQDQQFSQGRNDIVLTRSRDEGRTWSGIMNATPNEEGRDHFTPGIALAGGKIHLTYRTHAPTSLEADPMVKAVYRAIRRGKTIAGPIPLNKSSDANHAAFVTISASPTKFRFFGDYAAIDATARVAHPIWAQARAFKHARPNPDDTHQRAFSARVRIRRRR